MNETKMRTERIKKGWSLEYVGKQIGVSRVAVGQFETGKNKPSYDILVKIEDLFQLSHRELFS